MRRLVSCALLATATLLIATARPARAEEFGHRPATHGTGLGVGVEGMLIGGPAGLSVAYDGGPWHADGLLGVYKSATGVKADLDLGAQFWYHLHNGANSDFSLGGGLGFQHLGQPDADVVVIELGGQIRAFIASNVALSATLGFAIAAVDRHAFGLGGQLIAGQSMAPFAGVGLHYYFY
jgi:hypothetical protein